jgi:hypothetical protein
LLINYYFAFLFVSKQGDRSRSTLPTKTKK